MGHLKGKKVDVVFVWVLLVFLDVIHVMYGSTKIVGLLIVIINIKKIKSDSYFLEVYFLIFNYLTTNIQRHMNIVCLLILSKLFRFQRVSKINNELGS